MSFAIIVAADEANGIGKDGGLPWHLPGDMAFFKRTTTEAPAGKQNVVIMGRKTYASIPEKFRPLKARINLVLSRSSEHREDAGTLAASSLDAGLRNVRALANVNRVFVIGGGAVYNEAVAHPECGQVLLTRVHARFACDTYFPALDAAFELTDHSEPQRDGDVSYTFETYTRRR